MSQPSASPFSPLQFKSELLDALRYLKRFALNPVVQIRHLPDWSWPTLGAMVGIVSAAIGATSGLVRLKIGGALGGAILYPISASLVLALLGAFLYYTSLFLFQVRLQPKKLLILCFLSCLPWIAIAPFIYFLQILSPIGVILSALLAIVALTENTNLPRKAVVKLVGSIVVVFVMFWIINMITWHSPSDLKQDLATPQSMDILEKELRGN